MEAAGREGDNPLKSALGTDEGFVLECLDVDTDMYSFARFNTSRSWGGCGGLETYCQEWLVRLDVI